MVGVNVIEYRSSNDLIGLLSDVMVPHPPWLHKKVVTSLKSYQFIIDLSGGEFRLSLFFECKKTTKNDGVQYQGLLTVQAKKKLFLFHRGWSGVTLYVNDDTFYSVNNFFSHFLTIFQILNELFVAFNLHIFHKSIFFKVLIIQEFQNSWPRSVH